VRRLTATATGLLHRTSPVRIFFALLDVEQMLQVQDLIGEDAAPHIKQLDHKGIPEAIKDRGSATPAFNDASGA